MLLIGFGVVADAGVCVEVGESVAPVCFPLKAPLGLRKVDGDKLGT
jgi:hypothetical protein